MAKYLVLIYGDEQAWEAKSEAERSEAMAAHDRFSRAAGEAILGGEELFPTATATTLRGRGGSVVTDGSFLETKEALGGFYVLEAPDLDTVIGLARRLPELEETSGGVEIRPLVDHG